VSVDTRTKGRRLDSYRRQSLDRDLVVLVDPDLARLPVEIELYGRGLRGRKLGLDVGGYDGAVCPIELIRQRAR
jgi:hypothetical protein